MSVSDPLVKKLKGIILELRSGGGPISDDCEHLQSLCQTLELIFSKGLKVSNSWFNKCTYWTWISKLPSLSTKERISPMCSMAIEAIKKSKKTQTDTGRGRCFIRQALVKKFLVAPVQLLAKLEEFTAIWYNENDSVLGNEILREILQSLLLSLNDLSFDLELTNSSFLDLTWEIPVFRHYEFVPCDDLGLHLHTVKGYPLVVEVDKGSVAGEDNKIEVGDVLDEMCGQCLRGKGKMTMQSILEDYQGLPIHICVLKSYNREGYQFGPIKKLLEKSNISEPSLTSPKSDSLCDWDEKPPPEAILPEEIADEVPVHDSEGRASYNSVYLGKALLGKHGGVNMIEVGVAEVLSRSSSQQDVKLDLGEKDITVSCKHSKQTILHHLYTEVSACGRRTDKLLNFAFIAGLSMRFMPKTNLSLKRPKWRKRKALVSRDTILNLVQLRRTPAPKVVNTVGARKSSVNTKKRKRSPFKSPLTKMKIQMSPIFKHSPLKKKSKKNTVRSLFGTDDSDILTYLPVHEETNNDDDGDEKVTDLEAVANKLFPTDNSNARQILTDQSQESLQCSMLSDDDQRNEKALEDSLLEQMLELTPAVLDKLLEQNMGDIILRFYKQVKADSFPFQNMAFRLWTDVVKWFDSPNTCSMRYSEDSKKFWKVGWRLFGGRFINFMSGFKNESQVVFGDTERGNYSPQTSDINFAVPSFSVLREFNPYGSIGSREPGLLHDIIEVVSANLNHQSACLTYDGKKLKQGLTESHGDVDVLGFETGKTLQDRKDDLTNKFQQIQSVQNELKGYPNETDIRHLDEISRMSVVRILRQSLKDLSINIQEAKETRKKKEFSKTKLIEKGGDSNWRNGKYAFAVSAIIAFMHDIDELLKKVSEVLEQICQCLAYINGAKYLLGKKCNLRLCDKYVELPDTDKTESTRMIKQRTAKWFDLRKEAKVTGSTIYQAIGLDGCGKLKEHFDHVVCGIEEKKPSPEIQKFMDHGAANEINAVATVVTKVLPALYPDLVFYEEGCVEIKYVDNSKFMIVSPDGSLRSNQRLDSTVSAVELKCPYFKIHTSFPQRYLLQCLAEIEALNVQSLLYLCWTQDESMVFEVLRDSEFFQKAMKIAVDIYCSERPRKPSQLPPGLKEFREELLEKCKNVKIIGQFKSVTDDTNVHNEYNEKDVKVEDLSKLLEQINESHSGFYEIKREKASEAMVFLCCGLDRIWEKNSLRNAPVCWFPKGYSLSNETLRKVAEKVHDECHKAGIHVPAESFDGQWHNLVVRGIDGRPLTVLQKQKDVWHKVEKIQKSVIIKRLREIVLEPIVIRTDDCITCTNGGIRIPSMPGKRTKLQKSSSDETVFMETLEKQPLLSEVIPDVIASSAGVQEEVLEYCTFDEITEKDAFDANINLDVWQNTLSEQINESQTELSDQSLSEPEHEHVSEIQTLYSDKDNVNENNQPDPTKQPNLVMDKNPITKYKVTPNDAQKILAMLQTDNNSNKKGQWNNKDKSYVLEALSSKSGLSSLRDTDLRLVVRYFKKTQSMKVKESVPKNLKIQELSKLFGHTEEEECIKKKTAQNCTRKIKTLKDLSSAVLSRSVPKQILNIVYSEYIWPTEYNQWLSETPLANSPKVDGTEYPDVWFYVPEYSITRKQLEVRCIDSTHLLTRTRRKSCKGGLDGIPNAPWLKVAKSKKTFLSPVMVQEIVEPMSVKMALTHFSESVEREMRSNGDFQAAELCRDVRCWWKSEDDGGIPANDRVQMRIPLRKRLLSKVNFSEFPPPTVDINGWPLQLWEAIIANIDAKCLLYSLCHGGTYNVRAFSSMMGETFFSELTMDDKRGHGTITAEEFGHFIGTTVERLQTRLDPERKFTYRTARSNVYKLVNKVDEVPFSGLVENICPVCIERPLAIQAVHLRDHYFDSEERARKKGKQKEASMDRRRNAVMKGELGVRWIKARRNDSKLFATSRIGISDEC